MNYYAGIDIGGTSVKLCILDEQGNVTWEAAFPTQPGDAELMADQITGALRGSGYAFRAAGISCAGRVNKDTGTIIASNLKWMHVPFASIMEERLGCPVAIDNDVAGALYGEWSVGACHEVNHVAFIILGTGVGGAFIIDGKPFRGHNNTGGEVGHMITHGDGRPCACGGRGCFEQYASAPALSRMAGGLPTQEIFSRAAEGDAGMQHILDAYAHELAIGLGNIIGIFRPKQVVLGGGLANAGSALLDRVKYQLHHHCPNMPTQEIPEITLAKLGNKAGMIGGAMMARALLARRENA